MKKHVNNESLIREVKKWPVLWDQSHPSYKDKKEKKGTWNEICSALVPNFRTKSEAGQRLLMHDIMSKWRSIRDNYVRSLRKLSQTSTNMQRKSYIYSGLLSFLKLNKEFQTTESISQSITNANEDSYEYEQEEEDSEKIKVEEEEQEEIVMYDETDEIEMPSSSLLNTVPTPKRKRFDSEQEASTEFLNVQQIRTNIATPDKDEDLAFFYSLLPTVRQLNVDQKFTFRVQTMQVLHKLIKSVDSLIDQ